MGIGDIIGSLVGFFMVLATCGALTLAVLWLWRRITLPEGATPPKWNDLSVLRGAAGKAPLVLRLAVVAVLALMMSTPIDMIYNLVRERSESYREVVSELSQSWGGQQLLIGPVLSVPYTIKYPVKKQEALSDREKAQLAKRGLKQTHKEVTVEVTEEHTAIVLPEELRIKGKLEPEIRKRGIYSVRVYTVDLALSGLFRKPDFKALDPRTSEVHWDKALVLVNLSNTKAFRHISDLRVGDGNYQFVPGTRGSAVAPTGFSAEVDLSEPKDQAADKGSGAKRGDAPPKAIVGDAVHPADLPFAFDMAVGGSQGFFVAPIAVSSTIDISSSWPHPKYCGDGLPLTRVQSPTGFQAHWEVPNLVRNYPQLAGLDYFSQPVDWDHSVDGPDRARLRLAEYAVGVDLLEPVFHYSILTRAVKYAMMFIALTFLAVLIFEMSTGRRSGARLHLVQYGLIGLGLCLFYLVLLAASEQLPFTRAYLLAAGLNIAMIGGYVWASLKRAGAALLVAGILAALYAALFFILRMEEFALVSGTSLMVLAMIALMHVTRNLGRSGGPDGDKAPEPADHETT